jgi:ectoine hydroxylase-related dioxygenase (phytanoyl-CoA dioxygenase family)
MNGVTRFYGPYSQWLGGAHMDVGNAYLQKNTLDVDPVPGRLVLFPSYLAHKAMPYEGDNERIIVSFNAQVHAAGGDQIFNYDAT